jgi:hypothetical protein
MFGEDIVVSALETVVKFVMATAELTDTLEVDDGPAHAGIAINRTKRTPKTKYLFIFIVKMDFLPRN